MDSACKNIKQGLRAGRWKTLLIWSGFQSHTRTATFFSHNLTSLDHLRLFYDVPRSHSDISHSLGLHWTSDRPVAETSTWQYTPLKRDRYPCPRWDLNANPSKPAAIEGAATGIGVYCYYFILFYFILFYFILFYFILFYFISFYFISFHFISFLWQRINP